MTEPNVPAAPATATGNILAQMAAAMPGAVPLVGTVPQTVGGEPPDPSPGQLTTGFDSMTPEQVLGEAHRLLAENATLAESEQKWKNLARKHEREVKAARASNPAAVHTDPATPSELPSGAAGFEAERLRQENLRLTVAIEKKLPAVLAHRLVGEDKDELLEDADRLLALVTPPAPVPQLPRGSADGGAGVPPKAVQTQEDAWITALNKAIHG